MQKTCKIEGCQRKFEKTSHSDLCSVCTNAFRSGGVQTTKRLDNQNRQQTARANAQSTNRDINRIELASPPPPLQPNNPASNHSMMPPNMYSNIPPYMMPPNMLNPNMMYPNIFPPSTNTTGIFAPTPPQPTQPTAPIRNPTTNTTATTRPVTAPISSSRPPPPVNNLPNFPQLDISNQRPLPDINVNNLYTTFDSMQSGADNVDPDNAMKDMYGMMLHLFSKSSENDALKSTVGTCISRLDSLEAKVGNPDEPAIPLSIAVRFMPLPAPGQTDKQLIQLAFSEIRAPGVDVEQDIVKVVRLGDLTNGKLGTILVEMRNQECKAHIMKTKKCLENHPNHGLQKLIIKNAQTKSEIKTNIALNEILRKIPGEQNSFIAGNGRIMQQQQQEQQRYYQPLPTQYGRQQHYSTRQPNLVPLLQTKQHNQAPPQQNNQGPSQYNQSHPQQSMPARPSLPQPTHQYQGYQSQHAYPGAGFQYHRDSNYATLPQPFGSIPANPFAQFYPNQPNQYPTPAPTQPTEQVIHQSSSATNNILGQEDEITLDEDARDPEQDFIFEEMETQAEVHSSPP